MVQAPYGMTTANMTAWLIKTAAALLKEKVEPLAS